MNHNEAIQTQACEKYLLGELSTGQRDAFEEHYFSCSDCALQLRSTSEFLSASREILAALPESKANQDVSPTKAWFRWLNPLVAGPAFAALLLFIAYQNLVTIPRYQQLATSPRVLAMHSLIAANSRGAEGSSFSSAPNEPLGLYVDIPADSSHSLYLLRLEDPNGHSSLLRSVTAEEAQKTQVVVVNPGSLAGKYAVVISAQKDSTVPSAAEEVARLQFVVELAK